MSEQTPNEMTREELEALKVPELRDMLKEREMSVSGTKDELVSRLLGEETPSDEEGEVSEELEYTQPKVNGTGEAVYEPGTHPRTVRG